LYYTHFSGVEHEAGNEKRVTPIKKGDLRFEPLAEFLVDANPNVTIISSSPLLEHDAMYMKVIYERILTKKVSKDIKGKKVGKDEDEEEEEEEEERPRRVEKPKKVVEKPPKAEKAEKAVKVVEKKGKEKAKEKPAPKKLAPKKPVPKKAAPKPAKKRTSRRSEHKEVDEEDD
jgi:deoxyribonuclease-4